MKNGILKLLIVVLAIALCLVSCNQMPPEITKCDVCVDGNGDGVCDNCNGAFECSHKDISPADHLCDSCSEALGSCADGNSDHKCDTCERYLSSCLDVNGDGKCEVCSGAVECECSDRDPLDHKCDYCGVVVSSCENEEGNDHLCDICGKTTDTCANNAGGDHLCDVCGEVTDTCVNNAGNDHLCDVCGEITDTCANNAGSDHLCDVCGEVTDTCVNNAGGDHLCDICSEDLGPCSDGNSDHYCDACGAITSMEIPALTKEPLDLSVIGHYTDKQFIEINGNVPEFEDYQLAKSSYEYYGARDSLGRCTIAVALIGRDIMPTDGRGSISSVSPTGWHSSAIYERCHLIAFSLTGENANWENLITGTYDLNGVMQTYEDLVCDYVKETSNHVLYRVIPVFEGNNLLATGVQVEAYSIEDNGAGICFNIFIYNVETDYEIDYSNGDYELDSDSELNQCTFVINKRNKKFHLPTCSSVTDMSDANKLFSYDTYEVLVGGGYVPCGNCLKNYTP